MAKDGILWPSSRDQESHQSCLCASAETLQRSLRNVNGRETGPLGLLARLLTQLPVLLRARLQGPRAEVTALAPGQEGLPAPLGSRREEEREPGASEPCASHEFKGESLEGENVELSQVWSTQDTFGHHLEAGTCTSSLFWKASVQNTY